MPFSSWLYLSSHNIASNHFFHITEPHSSLFLSAHLLFFKSALGNCEGDSTLGTVIKEVSTFCISYYDRLPICVTDCPFAYCLFVCACHSFHLHACVYASISEFITLCLSVCMSLCLYVCLSLWIADSLIERPRKTFSPFLECKMILCLIFRSRMTRISYMKIYYRITVPPTINILPYPPSFQEYISPPFVTSHYTA